MKISPIQRGVRASTGRALARDPFFRFFTALCVTASVAAFSIGCSSTDGSEGMTPQEIAKRVNELRDEADACLTRFYKNSEDRAIGASLDDLLCYVEKNRETTELFPAPSDCPSCFARYGEGLRMLATWYRTLSLKQESELKRLGNDSVRAKELRKLADKNEDLARDNYREALQMFNMHLGSNGRLDDRVYWRGFECAARLERYKVAIEYLDRYERANTRLPKEEVERIAKYRAWAEDYYQRRVRDTIREELGNN